MANVFDVVKIFLSWSNKEGDLITNLKMQKLLYYAQAWYSANTDEYLFTDDFVAWDLGPVIPAVYREYKKFGAKPIEYKSNNKEIEKFSEVELDFLKEFYSKFIGYSAHDLVNASHNDDPWKNTQKNDIIPKNLIKEFYKKQIA